MSIFEGQKSTTRGLEGKNRIFAKISGKNSGRPAHFCVTPLRVQIIIALLRLKMWVTAFAFGFYVFYYCAHNSTRLYAPTVSKIGVTKAKIFIAISVTIFSAREVKKLTRKVIFLKNVCSKVIFTYARKNFHKFFVIFHFFTGIGDFLAFDGHFLRS